MPLTHFSRTSTLAPLDTILAAVARPPMPLPMIIASYSISVGASVGKDATTSAGGQAVATALARTVAALAEVADGSIGTACYRACMFESIEAKSLVPFQPHCLTTATHERSHELMHRWDSRT